MTENSPEALLNAQICSSSSSQTPQSFDEAILLDSTNSETASTDLQLNPKLRPFIINHSKTKEESWKIFAELRAKSRAKNPGPRDDDWLDDEQWYCENEADWSGEPVTVPVDVFHDPHRLKAYLESAFGHSMEEYPSASDVAQFVWEYMHV